MRKIKTGIVRRKAFVLIELLVALSIFAVVVTMLYRTFYTGLKAYHHTQSQLQLAKNTQRVIDKISVELRNSVAPYKAPAQEAEAGSFGRGNYLSFFTVRDIYSSEGKEKALARVSYAYRDKTLFRKEQRDKDIFLGENNFTEEALLADIESFAFEYLVAEAGSQGATFSWQQDWPCSSCMPRGIRMKFLVRDARAGREFFVEHYVVVSQGVLNCLLEER